jgi:hypothetical protein
VCFRLLGVAVNNPRSLWGWKMEKWAQPGAQQPATGDPNNKVSNGPYFTDLRRIASHSTDPWARSSPAKAGTI